MLFFFFTRPILIVMCKYTNMLRIVMSLCRKVMNIKEPYWCLVQLNESEDRVLKIDIVRLLHINEHFSDDNLVLYILCYYIITSQWRNSVFILWLGWQVSGLSTLLKDTWTGGATLRFKARPLPLGDNLDFKPPLRLDVWNKTALRY